MSDNDGALIVLCTCPGPVSAKKIAHKLVADKLAACVNVLPGVQSCFTWMGKLSESTEHLLLIKTTREVYPKLEQGIRAMHSYELPEIIAVPVYMGLDEYLKWIKDNTSAS